MASKKAAAPKSKKAEQKDVAGKAPEKDTAAAASGKKQFWKMKDGRKIYPLTVAQKFHFFYQSMITKKEVVNIGLSFTIELDFDREVLKRAIYTAYSRQEAMRVRFTKDENDEWWQYVVDKEHRDIEFVDFSDRTMDEATFVLRTWTKVPFEMYESPMNRIVMIRMPDGFNGVYFLVDHRIMDAQSIILFLRDIIEIYCSEVYPDDASFPKEMTSYLEQVERDLTYEDDSKQKQRDYEYFRALIEDTPEPIYNDLGTKRLLAVQREYYKRPELRAAINVTDSPDSALDIFSLEAEPTQKILDFCEEYHVSVASMLLMGLRTYFQKFNGNDDVSINTAIARRATLKEKRSGGTRIHSFPFRTIISRDTKYIDGIYEIRDKQNELFMHANFDPTMYFRMRGQKYPNNPKGATYEPMSLTYQPLTANRAGMEKVSDIRFKNQWYPNGATTQGMYLTVMHRPDDNGFNFNFEHQIKAMNRDDLEHLYYYLCKIMFRAIENPESTVGEIIDEV